MLTSKSVLRRRSDVVWERFDEGALLLLQERHWFLELNATASLAFALTDSVRTVGEVAQALESRFECRDRTMVLADVLQLGRCLLAEGALEVAEAERREGE